MPFHPTTDPGGNNRGPYPVEMSNAYRVIEEKKRERRHNRIIFAVSFAVVVAIAALIYAGC